MPSFDVVVCADWLPVNAPVLWREDCILDPLSLDVGSFLMKLYTVSFSLFKESRVVYRVVCRMIEWGFNEVLYLLYLLDRNAKWIFSTPLDWLKKYPDNNRAKLIRTRLYSYCNIFQLTVKWQKPNKPSQNNRACSQLRTQ